MRDCIHGVQLSETEVDCSNFEDLLHRGTVPISICDACPYFKANIKQDFFSATSALLVRKQRRGEIRVSQKPCGGCNETKHRPVNSTGPTTQFIWPYWLGGAIGDELRFSMRSIETFFQGNAKFLVIGDKPPWYTGPHIPKRRVKASTPARGFRDTLSKLYWMATKPQVDSEFVWMMDDIYFLKPFTIEDIQQPRADKWGGAQRNGWQKRKHATMMELQKRGLTTHDFGTHLPHFVNKQKLAELYEEYDLHNNVYLWEVLYGNIHCGTPIGPRPFFRRVTRKRNVETLRNLTKRAVVMNHTSAVWGPEMREFLEGLMPKPCSVEVGGDAPPTYRMTTRKTRVVKRRPPTVRQEPANAH